MYEAKQENKKISIILYRHLDLSTGRGKKRSMQISIALLINFHDSRFCGIKDREGRGEITAFYTIAVRRTVYATIRVTSSRYFLQANHFHRLTRRIIFLRMRDRKRLFLHRDVNEKKRKRKGKENTTKR